MGQEGHHAPLRALLEWYNIVHWSPLIKNQDVSTRYLETIPRHQEDKQSKATSSLFPIKMIANLEWTQSNVQQNIEQLQNPTMGATINNASTKTEPLP